MLFHVILTLWRSTSLSHNHADMSYRTLPCKSPKIKIHICSLREGIHITPFPRQPRTSRPANPNT